jgi:soluble lytic murein transglycosylase-like protein
MVTDVAHLLLALCGPGSVGLAPHVDHAAHVHHVRRSLLTAVIRVESRCKADAIGAKGELGLGQIKPETWAAGTYTREQLLTPRWNLLATARHLRRTIRLCGDERGGLGVYSGIRKCRDGRRSKYARTVLNFEAMATRPPES